jgi:ABC-type ATPase involved in cell division
VGAVFEDTVLLDALSAFQNVVHALRVADLTLTREAAELRAASALDRVGLSGDSTTRPGELAPERRTRLAVARSMVAEPKVLLVDLPVAQTRGLFELLREIAREGVGVLFAVADAGLGRGWDCRRLDIVRGLIVEDRREPALVGRAGRAG